MARLGRSHARVREIRGYRERAARERAGVFVAEGIHLAREALASGAPVRLALASDALLESEEGRDLERRLGASGVELHACAPTVLDSLQQARSAQPVLLVVERRAVVPSALLSAGGDGPLLLVADGLQDPGNLGALMRTAEAAGATAMVATGEGADLFHPKTVRATMGSVFRLPAWTMPAERLRRLADDAGIMGVAADPRGEREWHDCDLRGPVALVLGAEGRGLGQAWLDWVGLRLRIPMSGGVESLSVGAAGAILLFEARRQRTGARGEKPLLSRGG